MIYYGLQKTTLIDFPGKVAATLFTGGCNLRCPYCHNPELVNIVRTMDPFDLDYLKSFFIKRKNVLQGVCITGGEPLIHGEELTDFIKFLKDLGYLIKIDTNGTFPHRLKQIDPDYIAMDIKTSFDKYNLMGFTGMDAAEKLGESIAYILNSGIKYEFRTTVVPGLVDYDDIDKISDIIKGADNYTLSQFRPGKTLDEESSLIEPYDISILEKMKSICDGKDIKTKIRDNK